MRRSTVPSLLVRVAAGAGVSALLLAAVVLRAQQAPAAPAAPVPVAASSVLRTPEAFFDKTVSMSASVEALLTKTAFVVDQDRTRTTGRDVLVIAPSLNKPLPPNANITVIGQVFKFDPAEVAKRSKTYTLDLSPELVARFQGKAAVWATAVVTGEFVDLARREPPPMTPAEVALDKAMKAIQPASGALRAAVDASNAAAAKDQTAILKTAFLEVETFFKGRSTADAVGWAGEALKAVDAAAGASLVGKWDEARTAAGTIQGLCATCHAQHRERQDDGTFRVRGMTGG